MAKHKQPTKEELEEAQKKAIEAEPEKESDKLAKFFDAQFDFGIGYNM